MPPCVAVKQVPLCWAALKFYCNWLVGETHLAWNLLWPKFFSGLQYLLHGPIALWPNSRFTAGCYGYWEVAQKFSPPQWKYSCDWWTHSRPWKHVIRRYTQAGKLEDKCCCLLVLTAGFFFSIRRQTFISHRSLQDKVLPLGLLVLKNESSYGIFKAAETEIRKWGKAEQRKTNRCSQSHFCWVQVLFQQSQNIYAQYYYFCLHSNTSSAAFEPVSSLTGSICWQQRTAISDAIVAGCSVIGLIPQ